MKRIMPLLIFLLLAGIAYADYMPNRMSFQGYLRDEGNNPVTGTYSLDFVIFNLPVGGSNMWDVYDQSLTITRGIFNYDLNNLNLTGDQNYYLGIYINDVSMGRLNITQSMWAQRAQQANNLTETNNYTVTKLTVGNFSYDGKIGMRIPSANNFIFAFKTLSTTGLRFDLDYLRYVFTSLTGNDIWAFDLGGNMWSQNSINTTYLNSSEAKIGTVLYDGTVGLTLPAASAYAFQTAAAPSTGMYFSVDNSRYELHYLGVPVWWQYVTGGSWTAGPFNTSSITSGTLNTSIINTTEIGAQGNVRIGGELTAIGTTYANTINTTIINATEIDSTTRMRSIQYFSWDDQGALIQNNYMALSGATIPNVNGSGRPAIFDGRIVGLGVSCKTAGQGCSVNMSWTTAIGSGGSNTIHDNVLVLPGESFSNFTNTLNTPVVAGNVLRIFAYNYTCSTAPAECSVTMAVESR